MVAAVQCKLVLQLGSVAVNLFFSPPLLFSASRPGSVLDGAKNHPLALYAFTAKMNMSFQQSKLLF